MSSCQLTDRQKARAAAIEIQRDGLEDFLLQRLQNQVATDYLFSLVKHESAAAGRNKISDKRRERM